MSSSRPAALLLCLFAVPLGIYRLRTASKEQNASAKKKNDITGGKPRWHPPRDNTLKTRWEHFIENSRTWAAIKQHRSFLDAARIAAESYSASDRYAVLQQLDQARQTLEAFDPLRDLSRIVPEVAEPTPEDLKPFLGNWSPYGSDRSRGL